MATKPTEYRDMLREERLQAGDELRKSNSFISTTESPANWTKISDMFIGQEVAVAASSTLATFRRPLNPARLQRVTAGKVQPGDLIRAANGSHWRLVTAAELRQQGRTSLFLSCVSDLDCAEEQLAIRESTEVKFDKAGILAEDYYFEAEHCIWLPVLDRWIGDTASSLPPQSTPMLRSPVSIQVRTPIKRVKSPKYRPLTDADTLQPYDEACQSGNGDYGSVMFAPITELWYRQLVRGCPGQSFCRSVNAEVGEGFDWLPVVAKLQAGDESYCLVQDKFIPVEPEHYGSYAEGCHDLTRRPVAKLNLPEPGPGWVMLVPDEPVDDLDEAYFFDKGWVRFLELRWPGVAKEYGACVRRYAGYPTTLLNYAGGPLEPLQYGELLTADDVMWFKDEWRKLPASRVGQSELKYAQFFARLADTTELSPEPKPKPRTRDEHIAEFWISFAKAVGDAGGSLAFCKPSTTAVQMAEVLAQNGIRIVYDPKTIGK